MRNCVVAIVAGLTAVVSCESVVADVKDYVGRWNIKIEGTGDTFSTAWLRVVAGQGDLSGALMWKWGSVGPITDVSIDDAGLRFRRGRDSFRAKLVDAELRGVATMRNGDRFDFVGQRSPEMCDVTGTWTTWPAADADAHKGTIILDGDGTHITGKAYDPQKSAYAVQDAKLDGRMLSFKAVSTVRDVPPRTVECEIRGDAMIGVVKVPIPDQVEPMEVMIKGQRQRQWGKPMSLLQKNSLDGWGPRDTDKKFGWTVQDGVLENNPPDVDIMSHAKFGDFRLQLEYKVEPDSNSGVYLRGRYELQVLGSTKIQDHGNMAVYSRLKPSKNPLKPGEWNELDVTLIGRWLTVVLNGVIVHDNQYLEGPTGGAWDPSEEAPGPLLLQGDHGKVSYRNIVVTPAL